MRRKNTRSRDDLAEAYNKLDRNNLFERGVILLEARDHEIHGIHGEWLKWLKDEFGLPTTTAERYMSAARGSRQIPQNREFATSQDNDLRDLRAQEQRGTVDDPRRT